MEGGVALVRAEGISAGHGETQERGAEEETRGKGGSQGGLGVEGQLGKGGSQEVGPQVGLGSEDQHGNSSNGQRPIIMDPPPGFGSQEFGQPGYQAAPLATPPYPPRALSLEDLMY